MACLELMRLGVEVHWETHLKVEILQDRETGNMRPDWEKHTNTYLNQTLWYRKEFVRDDDNKKTGVVNYTVEFTKSKMNIDLANQKRIIATTRPNAPAEWHGLPELREGVL